jgi:hypothetical protein
MDEYYQLAEEGYLIGEEHAKPDRGWGQFLPLPAELRGDSNPNSGGESENEHEWEQAYWRLWQVREQGIRADFPYTEPDDFGTILAMADSPPKLQPLSQQEYEDRIKGAWFARCAGVVLGKPLEMGFDRMMVRRYLESVNAYPLDDWVPAMSEQLDIRLREDCVPSTRGNVRYVQPDDDIHYTVTSLLLAEKKGIHFTKLDAGMNLLDNIPYHWLWVADNQIYYHMVNLSSSRPLEEQAEDMRLMINPWRECMDGQLKADLWGYITPGEPHKGAEYIHRQSALSLVKNGLYGGMYVQGCISAALSKSPTVESIIAGGLSVIPANSRLACAVKDVIRWYEETPDWIVVCDRIYEKYGHWYFAAAIHNLCWVTLALLHGNLDYTSTITTAVMCGTDTDCNSATAASIVGAAIGYEKLMSKPNDERWINDIHDTVRTVVADFGHGTVSELALRTVAVQNKLFG